MRMRMKLGPMFLSAALLASASAGGADEPAAATGVPDAVLRTLAGLERRADRVRGDVEAAHARGQAPPPPLSRDVQRVRDAARALTHRLYGLPATEAMPLLARLDRLERTLAKVDARIADEPERILRTPRVRAALASGVITGRVTDARTGAPIGDLVEVWDAAGDFVDYGFTDQNGVYRVDSLPSGSYFVVTDTFDYVNELFDNIVCDPDCDVTTGTPVPVVDGQVTNGINFALVPLSVIEGTTLNAATLQPIAGARLRLFDEQGGTVNFATSDPDGHYRMDDVHAGVHFMLAEHDAYLDEVFDDVPCQPDCDPTTGTPILVTIGSDVAGIDFRLRLGGSLSGRVVDAGSGEPIPSTVVEIYDAGDDFVGLTFADETGRFQEFDLSAGTYFALTSSFSHADELYDNLPCSPSCVPTQGTPIAVSAGQERPGVDFALLRLGSLSGRVTNAIGAGIPGAQVRVFDAQGLLREYGFSDETGAYEVGGLSTGNHFAAAAASGYLGELFDNLPCHPTCTPTFGTPIPVVLGGTTTGVNFRLDLGGWIAGVVRRQANGTPVSNAEVTVFNSNGQIVDSESTSAGGNFIVSGLNAGTYFARADANEHLSELYREITCNPDCPPPASGTAIPVVAGQASDGVDFTLTRLGRITGRVTETGTGLPLLTLVYLYGSSGQFVTLEVGSGSYLFTGLLPGTYFVKTDSLAENIVDELYNNRTCEPACTVTTGTPVAAALDTTTSGVDFSLRRPVFVDVPVTHFAWKWVEAVYNAGVTAGCGGPPARYCPDTSVTRAQMAVFLLRAKEGPAYVPPPAVGMFVDVPASDPFAPWIEELARRQIAGGCAANPPRFCPNDPTTRAQMAPLLLVTKEGGGYVPPPAVGAFQDVPASDPFARWIEELVRRQVTGGCSADPPLYCPGQATSRAQMAIFLTTTFGLPLP